MQRRTIIVHVKSIVDPEDPTYLGEKLYVMDGGENGRKLYMARAPSGEYVLGELIAVRYDGRGMSVTFIKPIRA